MSKIDEYHPIDDLPTSLDMGGQPIRVQKLYGAWFVLNKEKRIKELIKVVKSTNGYEGWNPDFSKDSLLLLGRWLKENITTRKMTKEEYMEQRRKTPNYIEICDWELTYRSMSLLYDAGIYFGETFNHTFPSYKWEQCLSRAKYYVDVGHMLIKINKYVMNPALQLRVIGLKLVEGTENEIVLYNMFENWTHYAKEEKK